jgi:hypothetical protein
MSGNGARRRTRRTFSARFKETMVEAYDMVEPLSPAAGEALLKAEGIPLSYLTRWREEMPKDGDAPRTCRSCRGSGRHPKPHHGIERRRRF